MMNKDKTYAAPGGRTMDEFHTAKAFAREEPRVELIESMLKSILDVVDLEFEGRPVRVDGFRLRDLEDWRTVNETSLEQNLGSLSTACNCKCAFCYEEGNPKGLFEKQPRFVGMAEARTRLRHLHDGRGLFRESKGFFEPLANPDFLAILGLIREHEPELVIDVTTNGALLTPEIVSRLAELSPVYVNLSLISADPDMRKTVMGDPRAASAIGAVELLRESGIPFMGTVVPWPEQGLGDITSTIEYLDSHDARVIRISMPGLTKYHPKYEPGTIEAWLPEIVRHVLPLRSRLQTPIIISPHAYVSVSLDAVVEGVIKRSPAAEAGIRLGDRLLAIDGREVVSRAHAASLLRRATEKGSVTIELERAGTTLTATLEEPSREVDAYPYKPAGTRPIDFPGLSFGLCLPGSFHLQYMKQIHAAIHGRNARRTLVVVSPFFRDLVGDLMAGLPLPEGSQFELVVPQNDFFGGNVGIGDLWVLDDIVRAVQPYLELQPRPDLLVLPSSFLSRWGRDLRGIPYGELETRLGIEVALVKCERIVL
jgi:uncharacterized Fe-S cluster-containing radical SAM superfamily protein